MAAIFDESGTLDISKLSTDLKEHLAFYAVPRFIRILTKIDLTGIFINNICSITMPVVYNSRHFFASRYLLAINCLI